MTRLTTLFTLMAIAVAIILIPAAPSHAQVPDEFNNLKVLDKDIGEQELIGIMKGWAGGWVFDATTAMSVQTTFREWTSPWMRRSTSGRHGRWSRW